MRAWVGQNLVETSHLQGDVCGKCFLTQLRATGLPWRGLGFRLLQTASLERPLWKGLGPTGESRLKALAVGQALF